MTAKSAKKIMTFCLAAIMAFSVMATPMAAFAADSGDNAYPSSLEKLTVDVKADATAASIKEDILDTLKAANPSLGIAGINWPSDADVTAAGTVNAEVTFASSNTASVEIEIENVIAPSGYQLAVTLDDIYADDAKNASKNSLLAYVNSDLTVVASGSAAYKAALGTPAQLKNASKFTWSNSSNEYASLGGLTYTFTQSYTPESGTTVTLTRSVTVRSKTATIGSVAVNYTNNTVNTTKNMKWSLDQEKWSGCQDNMKINSSWYDNVVYFLIPESKYVAASGIVSVYIPEKSEKPDAKLSLSSTVSSVTINNCWDFNYVEFSIDGENWVTTKANTYTFYNLDANTSYSVSVRTRCQTGISLASDAVKSSIKTKEALKTDATVDHDADDETSKAYVNATVVIAPSIVGGTMSGSLDPVLLTKFGNIFDTYDATYRYVDSSLTILHHAEEDEIANITTTNFAIPMSVVKDEIANGGLTIEYRSEFGRVYLSNGALSYLLEKSRAGSIDFTMKKINNVNNNTSWQWIRNAIKGNYGELYHFEVGVTRAKDANITYFIPYKLESRDVLNALSVYNVGTNGSKTLISFTYNDMLGGIEFTTHMSGYFAIIRDGLVRESFPFADVSSEHWAYSYIKYCYNQGLFVGTSKTTFTPNMEVNRATIITLLGRLAGVDASATPKNIRFTDVDVDDWYAPYAVWAYDAGLIKNKTFDGMMPMTREEIAQLIYTWLEKEGFELAYTEADIDVYSDAKSITGKYKDAVYAMQFIGIMEGVTNDTFDPKGTVTRAQMATIIYRLYTFVN